jgi:hypothetical protein
MKIRDSFESFHVPFFCLVWALSFILLPVTLPPIPVHVQLTGGMDEALETDGMLL